MTGNPIARTWAGMRPGHRVTALSGIGALALIVLFFAFAPYYSTHLIWGLRTALPYLLPLIVLIAAALWAGFHTERRRNDRKPYQLLATGYVIAGVLGVGIFASGVSSAATSAKPSTAPPSRSPPATPRPSVSAHRSRSPRPRRG